MKKAFTMIELVFVIVVLGILAAVAVPRLVGTRDDAIITKLRADVAAVQSGITLKRSEDMMKGVMKRLARLDQKEDGTSCGSPFCAITQNAIKGNWETQDGVNYKFKISSNKYLNFIYQDGTFECKKDDADCKEYLH